MKKTLVGLIVLGVLLLAVPAVAQDTITFTIEAPLGQTVVEGPAGSSYAYTSDVPIEAQGLTCSVSDKADNNKSVHLGNNIVVTSASGKVILEDVERGPGVTTTGAGTLVLGATITATIVLSPEPNWYDRSIFSGVHVLTVTCETQPPPTTTTTTPETPTTTIPEETTTTTPPESTTTTNPPEMTTTTGPPDTTTTNPPPETTTTTEAPTEPEEKEICITDDEGNNVIVTIVDGVEVDRQPALACTGPVTAPSQGDHLVPFVVLGQALLLLGLALGLSAAKGGK